MHGKNSRHLIVLFALALTLHGAMFVYDLSHPQIFLHADRAGDRLQVAQTLAESVHSVSSLATLLVSNGIVGDYLPQALLYVIGGRPAVITAQIALLMLSLYALFELCLALTQSPACSLAASLLYLLLPNSLVFPHVLTSEAIFDPLVLISFYGVTRALLQRQRGAGAWGGLAIGLATLVRPVAALWPFAVSLAMKLGRLSWRETAAYLGLALLPLLLWMSAVQQSTGEFSLGDSGHDAAHNLYKRVERISHVMPAAQRERVEQTYLEHDGRKSVLSMGSMLHFIAEYPGSYFQYLQKDTLVFFFKSGVEKFTLDYLDADPALSADLQCAALPSCFRSQLERDGTVQTALRVYGRDPVIAIISMLSACVFTLIMALAVYGTVRAIGDGAVRANARITVGLLAAFPLYLFATSQIVDAMQSRGRAPAEFGISVLAVIGACYALPRLRLELLRFRSST